ncbi:MAG: MBL fold metallo-hydrolase, partial [Deltaproteobacteria bacterium]|nr:MBL fold metallo-hydrolase [Deltaproteobacteria bacterium]
MEAESLERSGTMVTYTGVREVDKVEIVTLQDNYIDLTTQDNSAVISRASAIQNGEIRNSIQAEHGFSAIIRTTVGNSTRTMLFDFGFSPIGAAYNAKALGISMEEVEVMALSHGHSDHTGGIAALTRMIGRPGVGLVLHPSAFVYPRYLKFSEELKMFFPKLTRESLEAEEIEVIETATPYPLLGGQVIFLGEVERTTDFEKGLPTAYRENENGEEEWDPIEDDTAIVMNVKGKGLIVLSGCSHSGIVNTVRHAMKVTGIEKVHAVMGGFHLGGPLFEPIIDRTTEELKKIDPDYMIPCHCTGRKAIMHMEQA